MTGRRRLIIVTASSAAGLYMLAIHFFPWSPLNCRHEDIDLNSGLVRHTRYIFFMKVRDRVEETWLSKSVDDPAGPPDWRRVNTFSPRLGHSPHYRFHGAISQIRELELLDELLPFENAARSRVAADLLALWRTSDSDGSADEYLSRLSTVVIERRDAGAARLSVADLPPRTRNS